MKFKKQYVYNIPDYEFSGIEGKGKSKPKLALILSDPNEKTYMIYTLTTSQIDKYKEILTDKQYVIVPGGGIFKLDTMIKVESIVKRKPSRFDGKKIKEVGKLDDEYFFEVIEKIKNSPKYRNIS